MSNIPDNWVHEYGEHLRAGRIENMLALKQDYFPNSFYKYRTLNTTFLKCLKDGWLYMSEPFRLNDPFECSLLIDNNKVLADFITNEVYSRIAPTFSDNEKQAIRESPEPYLVYVEIMKKRGLSLPLSSKTQSERIKNMWDKDAAERIKTFRICSFSTTNESLLMWAHYSDEYKGICVEYDFINESDTRAFIHPVSYGSARPTVNSYEEVQAITFAQIYASVCKSIDWQYEQEWRYIAFLESQIEGKENRLRVPVPKAIYLGPLFELNNEELKSELYETATQSSIPVHQMVLHESEYKVRLK